jgi:WD40 repeat protein
MAPSSGTFRVLVSSALRDFAEERKILHAEVFPKLWTQCRRQGCRFEAVSLHWENSLAEIARNRTGSPRPSFLCLLGDHWDQWPLPEAIPAAEFALIDKRAPAAEAAFLHEWYRLDENALQPAYVLDRAPRVSSQAGSWEPGVEGKIRTLLARTTRELDLAAADCLKYQASAAEQEIRAALARAEGGCRVLCLSRISAGGRPEEDAESRARLQALKRQLRGLLGQDYCEYRAESMEVFSATATAALSRAIQAEMGRGERSGSAGYEDAAHEAFGRERARYFVGRAKPVQRIAEYLHGADPHPLVVAGPPGSGKSALLAHSVERYRALRREAAVVYRSAGATAESADGRALLEDICRSLDAGALGSTGYAELIGLFPDRLAAAARGTAAVVLDGLEQLPKHDQTRDLEWLPSVLPAGARLVVSAADGETLARLRKKVPAANIVELEPMTAAEGERLLGEWLRAAGRTLTMSQRARVLEAFGSCPLPLYLKLAFEEARRWRSFDPADIFSPAPDVGGQIDTVLARLSARHGQTPVSRCLGYLAASRAGLTEDELLDLLSRDNAAASSTSAALCADLRPYLAERACGGATLLTLAHAAFAEAAGQGSLAREERRASHQALARYFAESSCPARRFAELARQQALGGMWPALEATLTSFEFVEGRLQAGLLSDLIEDYRIAEACWRSEKMGAPPWHEWARFLLAEARAIETHIGVYPQMFFQQAFNQSRQGRVSRAAQAVLKQGRGPQQPWFERVNRPEYPPSHDSVAAFEGHCGAVGSVVLSPDGGMAASGAADGTLRVWSVATGACVRVLRGHASGVMALLLVDGDRLVSASWDCSVRVWDLHTGECLHVLGADTCPVVSLAQTGPNTVAAGAADGGLRLWDITSGRCLATMKGHRDRINCILRLSGNRFASASDDGSVHIWNENGARAGVLSGHGGPVLHLARIGDAVAASARSGRVFIWDLDSGKTRDVLAGHRGAVAGTAVLDATRMVSWSYDSTLRLWSLVDASQLAVMHRHQGPVTCVEVLADGRLLSGSQDATLRLWGSRGEPLGVVGSHRSWVTAIAAARSLAISASRDGTLRVWDLDAPVSEQAPRPAKAPADIVRSRDLEGVYVVDATTAISLTSEPESLQSWNLAEGRCVQSVPAASDAGQQLRQRIRALTGVSGPTYCGGPRSQWGFTITGAAGANDGSAGGLVLTRERQREGGMFDYETRPLALYPLVCRPFSWTFECEYGIAFDARTREPHIVRVHHNQAGAKDHDEAPSQPRGARSLLGRFLGRGERT